MSSGLRMDASAGKSGLSLATVSGWRSTTSSPLYSSASAARMPGPPELVSTAVWRERGRGRPENAMAMSNSSSMEPARSTPACASSASTAVSLAASAPVCEEAARAPTRERPDFTTMITTFSLCPGNPRCLLYRGAPVVLITATEHYGAVLNGDFDFIPYLDELARNRLNLSRLFTFYRELASSIPPLDYANTLAPRPGREVMPWKRTGPGKAHDGGLKFDLTQWNPEYFARLKRFLSE